MVDSETIDTEFSEKEEKIMKVINEVGLEKLKAIKELLPEDISYEDIKLVITKNELK